MALLQRITVSKRTIGLGLVAVGWLFLPASRAQACNHPTIVSFASSDVSERSTNPTTPLVRKPVKPAVAQHNPFDPLGPCQGPQCDGRPERPDRPLTSPAPTKVRDTWNLAWTETSAEELMPASRFWLELDVPSPIQFHDPIFHPPRA